MSTREILVDTASRIFADHCTKLSLDAAEEGEFPDTLLAVIREAGFHEMAMTHSGISLADVFCVIKEAGRYAVPLHFPELILGCRWLGRSEALVSVGPGSATGAYAVPWGRACQQVVSIGEDTVAAINAFATEPGSNLAGESRDTLTSNQVEVLTPGEDCFVLMALARTLQMAGALERILDLSLRYAGEREQFGRPIARFQAIQHNLAVMACEVAAATRAADAALGVLESADAGMLELEVAAAKARVGESCGVVAETAHQVHGAMGYTYEHQLHHFTRRLWAWRDEYGDESFWQSRLGRHVSALGADALWDFVATRS
jgi:acyl-CoA dehydrogenase